jgi:molybdopterin synthase catalytic subunit
MLARLQDSPLDVTEVLSAVSDPLCGAQALFVGAVRDHDGGKAVSRLTYEAHPSATDELTRVCALAAGRLGVVHVAALHRTGVLAVGEPAVIVAASAPHRAEALEACRWLIDTLKHEVPIWKHQLFDDGTEEWVGAC